MFRTATKLVEQAVAKKSTQRPRRYRRTLSAFLGASAAAGCVLAAQSVVYLDSSSSPGGRASPFESLRRRKSTDSFDSTRRPVDVYATLRQHEETCFTDGKETGVRRYDIVQVSRCV